MGLEMNDRMLRGTYIVLFVSLIIAGFLLINYKDPKFQNAGLIYVLLDLMSIAILYFGPKFFKK